VTSNLKFPSIKNVLELDLQNLAQFLLVAFISRVYSMQEIGILYWI